MGCGWLDHASAEPVRVVCDQLCRGRWNMIGCQSAVNSSKQLIASCPVTSTILNERCNRIRNRYCRRSLLWTNLIFERIYGYIEKLENVLLLISFSTDSLSKLRSSFIKKIKISKCSERFILFRGRFSMVALLLLIKKNCYSIAIFVNEQISGSTRRISSRFTNLKRKPITTFCT